MMKPNESEIVWKRVSELVVFWPQAQRPLESKRAAHIAEALDPDLLGVIIICRTPAAVFHIIDGQHRVAGVKSAFGEQQLVPCKLVLNCDGPARAAQLFVLYNTTAKSPNAIAVHRVRVTEGDPIAQGIDKILNKRGLVIDPGMQDGCVRCVHVCTTIFKRHGGPVLGRALDALIQTWGRDRNAFDGFLVSGFSLFFARHGTRVDVGRLCERVSKQLTPGRLIGQAKTIAEMSAKSGGTAGAIVNILVNTYNHNLKNGRLGEPGMRHAEAAE